MKFKLNSSLKIVILALFALYPIIWFLGKGNVLINGLDTNFPLDPIVWFTRRFYIWNEVLNGGLHFSSSVAGLFFHLLQVIPYSVGAPLQIVEITNILFWSIAIVMSGYVFSKTFITKRYVLQVLFVVLYVFNIYLFNTWENIKVANISLMVGLPLVLSLIHNRSYSKLSVAATLLLSTLVGFISAGTGINPAYFLCLLLGAFIYVVLLLIIKPKKLETLRAAATVLIPFVLINSFWIFPLVDFLFITNTVQGLEGIGFTNWVASLSENTSLLNVIRLQGAWDWYIRNDYGVPLYIPYASRYFYSTPFIIFSFLTPLLAIGAFILRKSKQYESMIFFSFLAVLGIFLGAGTHEPTGTLFVFLLNNLPFFSFFRSPWYIFTPFTIIGIGGLAVIFIDELYERFSKVHLLKRLRGNMILTGLVGVFVCGQMLYSYPLITGKIFRPGRDDSFYQYFPQHVFDTKKFLASADYDRIVTYPDDQLESFKWGYKGTESILSLFSTKEVVAPSFNYPNQNLAALVQNFYSQLKRGETQSAFNMVHTLGVDSMFIKEDTITLSPDILKDVEDYTSDRKTIGPWHFMSINDEYVARKFNIPEHIYTLDISPNKLSELSQFISPTSIIVERKDSQLENIPELASSFSTITEGKLVPSQRSDDLTYTYTTTPGFAYSLYFTNYNLSSRDTSIVINSSTVPQTSISVENNALKVGPLDLISNENIITLNTPKAQTEVLIDSKGIDILGTPTIETKLNIPVKNFSPFKKYKITYEHIYEYGEQPEFQIVQSGPGAPYQIKPITLLKSQDWLDNEIVFQPVELSSKLEIIIKQPKQTNSVSKVSLRNFEITEIYENNIYVVQEPKPLYSSVPKLEFRKISPVKYEVFVTNASQGYFLAMREGYHRGWTINSKDYIGGKPVHLTANGYSNLWYIPVGGESQNITVSFIGQIYYRMGAAISVLTLVITGLHFIYATKKRT